MVRSTVFKDRASSSTDSSGSNGALKPAEIPLEGMSRGIGGFNVLVPLRKLMIRSCFPKYLPFTVS